MNKIVQKSRGPAFSLIEVLVAVAVLTLMITLLLGIVSESSRMWQRAEGQKSRRQAARIILETVKRDLESAAFPLSASGTNTLNFVLNPAIPEINNRDSAFWQARSPGEEGMAEVGYFVRWQDGRPALCRYYVPATNADSIFRQPASWLNAGKIASYAGLNGTNFRGLLAENVLGLWITLYDKNQATNGIGATYDSRTSTNRPAYAQVGIALIDPRTAQRIDSPSDITSAYSGDIASFPGKLPAKLREGVQTFETRIELRAAP